jgi:uncharacterized protein involved in outer membrane biogenesis
MSKRKHHVLIWVGSIFGVITIAAVIFVATLDWNKAKPYISAGISKLTGRQLSINGDLQVDLGWISRVRVSQIQFENAQWSKQPQMAEVGLVDVQVDLWQLLSRFRLVLPNVTVSQPKLILEKNAEGSPNWELGAAPAVTEPVMAQKRTGVPVIEKLVIKDGFAVYEPGN